MTKKESVEALKNVPDDYEAIRDFEFWGPNTDNSQLNTAGVDSAIIRDNEKQVHIC